MPTIIFYVAESLVTTGEYVKDLDEVNEPEWSADLSEAQWSLSSDKVQSYINRFEIGAKVKEVGANVPPGKPPLP